MCLKHPLVREGTEGNCVKPLGMPKAAVPTQFGWAGALVSATLRTLPHVQLKV